MTSSAEIRDARRCHDPEASTYSVAGDGRSITFQPCGITSWHPKDVEHRYCAGCGLIIYRRAP